MVCDFITAKDEISYLFNVKHLDLTHAPLRLNKAVRAKVKNLKKIDYRREIRAESDEILTILGQKKDSQ